MPARYPVIAEVLVLDEADRLLDMGFRAHLDAIMKRLPRQRRTGLFSATQTEAVEALSRAGLRNPVRVNVAVNIGAGGKGKDDAGQKTPTTLQAGFIECNEDDKLPLLLAFLKRWGSSQKSIVYALSCASVEFFSLALAGFKEEAGQTQVWALHGKVICFPTIKQGIRCVPGAQSLYRAPTH